MSEARAKTAEEVRHEFIDLIRAYSKYWSELSNKTPQERCDGLAFSILNIFDGTTWLPAMNIHLSPHPDDADYCKEIKESWYEPDMVINDCMLHELWKDSK